MTWKVNIIDHTADEAIEVIAESVEELFTAAAYGMKDVLVEPFQTDAISVKQFYLQESSLEELLVKFLDEINFYFQTERWIIVDVRTLKIERASDGYKLFAEADGEHYIEQKHILKHEIKAVTFHQMKIIESNNGFTTRIVFDI